MFFLLVFYFLKHLHDMARVLVEFKILLGLLAFLGVELGLCAMAFFVSEAISF